MRARLVSRSGGITAGVIEHPRHVFSRSPLAEVADIYNRWNNRPRIIVQRAAVTVD